MADGTIYVGISPDTNKPMYTTYFYTAREAVIHGYEADTKVRVVSLEKRGTRCVVRIAGAEVA